MTENELEARIGVEQTAEHQPHRLGAGLEREAPGGANERGMRPGVVAVIGLDYGGVRVGGMDIQRHVERGGPLENRPVAPVVEKRSVAQAVQHAALEAE